MLRNSIKSSPSKTAFAKVLRKDQTPGEKALWRKIRSRRFYGFKFRRQVPIGPYIADFLCIDKKLIIEIDGYTHFEEGAAEKDKKREDYLIKKGFKVIRFKNSTALENIDYIFGELKRFLDIS